jgi:hypothetical protein
MALCLIQNSLHESMLIYSSCAPALRMQLDVVASPLLPMTSSFSFAMIKPRSLAYVPFSLGKMSARMFETLMTRVVRLTLALEMNPLAQLLGLDQLATLPKRTRKPKSVSHGRYLLSTTKESLSARMKKTRTRKI